MEVKLSQRREKFAQLLAEGEKQSDAYRKVFNVKPTTKPDSIHQAASKLAAKVAPRVAELRKPVVERVQLTLERHLSDLEQLKALATQAEQYSAAIKAEELRGKASGIYTEKHQLSGPDGLPLNICIEFVKP